MSAREPVEYAGVVASADGLAEKGSRDRVPGSEIRSIEFMRGSTAQHPFWMFLFGLILVGLGLFSLQRIFAWWFQGAQIMESNFLMVWLLVIGTYALWEAVKREPLLLIRTTRGSRRLEFQGAVTVEEVQEFLQRLESEFGYTVRSPLRDGS